MLMFKGSLPPLIGLAIYQSPAVAAHFGTVGYLVAIASILGFCIMPRGKFIQTMLLNVTTICFAAALNLLALYCVTQARWNTTPAGSPPAAYEAYNSSASAVCAVWLMVEIYFINVIRASRPQFTFPCILVTIFTLVSLTYGVAFPDMATAISFMERLLEAFLSGFGIATGVHFLVFPMSSRMVVFKEMAGFLNLMNGVLHTQTAYMASLETFEPSKGLGEDSADQDGKKSKKNKEEKPQGYLATPASLKLKGLIAKLLELQTKLQGDITPAKREFAIGKLESHDLTELGKLLRLLTVPVLGLAALANILERVAESGNWTQGDGEVTEQDEAARQHQIHRLHFLMKQLHEPFASMTASIGRAFRHVLLVLELEKPPKKRQHDEESKGDEPAAPGTVGFAEVFRKEVDDFYITKQKTLREWCHDKGIELPPDFFETSLVRPEKINTIAEHQREHYQKQLFFTLYLEYLLWRVGASVLDLVLYVDKRKQDGVLKKSRLIFPGSKTLYKWLKAVFGQEDLSEESSYTADMDSGGAQSMYLGGDFEKKRDPEHLPPRNALQRFGNGVRMIPK